MDVCNMTYVKNTSVHKLSKQQQHPVYKDKSDTRRKVLILRLIFILLQIDHAPIVSYTKILF